MSVEEYLSRKKPLIAVHRGKNGGNIVENTIYAVNCSIMSGADIVEFDVAKSLDNEVFVFHTGMEHNLFWSFFPISLLPAKLIKRIKCRNTYGMNSGYSLNTLDEYLEAVKGRCLINLDRIWKANVKQCLDIVRSHGMEASTIVKTNVNGEGIRILDELKAYPSIFYMAIVRNKEQLDKIERIAKEKNVAIRGLEVIFRNDDDYFASDEFFDRARKNGWVIWVNAITLNGRPDMCAEHGDNVSIMNGGDVGWGWLVDKGYDIIQTDWPALLKPYCEKAQQQKL